MKKKKLSERMQKIIDCVPPCEILADVGCDHALISLALTDLGRVKKVIASDLREGPLERAKENLKERGYEDRFFLRRCGGLSGYLPGEAEVILISGMGGLLIASILKEGEEVARFAKTLVLEPQSDVDEVRKTLRILGFSITEEKMAKEEGKYYQIIRAERCEGEKREESDPVFDKYGPLLLKNKDDRLYEFLSARKANLDRILSDPNLNTSENEDSLERLSYLKKEAKEVETALGFFQ